MKIEVTPQEAAAVYTGKAIALMETACKCMGISCKDCPMRVSPQETDILKVSFCMKDNFIKAITDK